MNVYAIEAYGFFTGGMAIVAAESEAQAVSLATDSDRSVDYADPSQVTLLPCTCDGDPRVLIYYSYSE